MMPAYNSEYQGSSVRNRHIPGGKQELDSVSLERRNSWGHVKLSYSYLFNPISDNDDQEQISEKRQLTV